MKTKTIWIIAAVALFLYVIGGAGRTTTVTVEPGDTTQGW